MASPFEPTANSKPTPNPTNKVLVTLVAALGVAVVGYSSEAVTGSCRKAGTAS